MGLKTFVGPLRSGEYFNVYPDPPLINDHNISQSANILVDDGFVDIEAMNGVFHGVDGVLRPRALQLTVYELSKYHYKGMNTMFNLMKKSSLEEMLSGEGPFTVLSEHPDHCSLCYCSAYDILFEQTSF